MVAGGKSVATWPSCWGLVEPHSRRLCECLNSEGLTGRSIGGAGATFVVEWYRTRDGDFTMKYSHRRCGPSSATAELPLGQGGFAKLPAGQGDRGQEDHSANAALSAGPI
jgi:hypothetical protein